MTAAHLKQERVRALIGAIARHHAGHGYAPSVRELQAETGLSSTSEVWRWLQVCEGAGLIERVPRIARAVILTTAGRALAGEPVTGEAPPASGGSAT